MSKNDLADIKAVLLWTMFILLATISISTFCHIPPVEITLDEEFAFVFHEGNTTQYAPLTFEKYGNYDIFNSLCEELKGSFHCASWNSCVCHVYIEKEDGE